MSGAKDLLNTMPFAGFLGLSLVEGADGPVLKMPYRDDLIGNPLLPALHGGTIGAFMEITAMAHLAFYEDSPHQPRPIDVNVQYLRSGKPRDCYARARITRSGRTISSLEVHCWQEEETAPIARLQAHFLKG